MQTRHTVLAAVADTQGYDALTAILGDAYRILRTDGAQSAYAALRAQAVDAAFLYLDSADPMGLEAIAEIKADPAVADIPIIAVCAQSDELQRQMLLKGADGFFTLQYDPIVVRVLVRNILERYIRTRRQLAYERVINDCLKLVYSAALTDETFDTLLRICANYMSAERAYVYEAKGGMVQCALEWTAEGVAPQCTALRSVPLEIMSLYEEVVGDKLYTYIENAEDIRESNPGVYARLREQGIESIAMMLIRVEGTLRGLIGFDNPSMHGAELRAFFDNVFFFINIAVDKEVKNRRLQKITFYDPLTGLMNRAMFYREISKWELAGNEPAGIIYIDVNGLKTVNDRESHEAGDALLQECAALLQAQCAQEHIFRIGGDEFVVIMPGTDAAAFPGKVAQIKDAFARHIRCKAAVGSCLWAPGMDFRACIVAADHAMYKDKDSFYAQMRRESRRS